MIVKGTNHGNAVVLSEPVLASQYVSLEQSLSEFRFMNRIVGFSNDAIFVCTGKSAKSGYYEMKCDATPWTEVSDVRLNRTFSLGSVAFGIALIVLGVALFYMGWIAKTHTGPAVFWMPFAAPVAGLAFIFGARRLRLSVLTPAGRRSWYAPPLFKEEDALRERLNRVPGITF